jgi:hypothetical protein
MPERFLKGKYFEWNKILAIFRWACDKQNMQQDGLLKSKKKTKITQQLFGYNSCTISANVFYETR